MEEKRKRIRTDLRGLITGEVWTDPLTLAAYSTDASLLQLQPLVVVAPRTTAELAEVVRYAAQEQLPIHPRGAGTGLAGEALGTGLVLDTQRHLNRILEVGRDWVRVQPGVRWWQIQRLLQPQQRMFAPDPISGDACTIGGMLATDAGGPHSLRYGTTRDHVLSLTVVLADGTLAEIGREIIPPWVALDEPEHAVARITREVTNVLRMYERAIVAEQPPTLYKPGGYNLRNVLTHHAVDLGRLLVGSEGTLAVFAEAKLATCPLPTCRGLLLVSCPSLEAAAALGVATLSFQPTACELLDRRLVTILRESMPPFRSWVTDRAEAVLMIEQQDNSAEVLQQRLRAMSEWISQQRPPQLALTILQREDDLTLCWQGRNHATAQLAQTGDHSKPIPFVENTAVPPHRLPDYLGRIQQIMRQHRLSAAYTAHVGVGILHARPLLDLRQPGQQTILAEISEQILDTVREFGGTFNAEHAVGRLRTPLLPRQYPRLFSAFRRIKAAFDPNHLLNPGVIVLVEHHNPFHHLREQRETSEATEPGETSFSNDHDTSLAAGRLRGREHPEEWLTAPDSPGERLLTGAPASFVASTPTLSATYTPLLRWPELTVLQTSAACNGCGSCRTRLPEKRMCPVFKHREEELAAPRAKANLFRQVLLGDLPADMLSSDEFRQVADLCVNCKMCRVECPSRVDISKLMLEAKAANVAEQGLPMRDWLFSELEAWATWGSRNARVVNWLLSQTWARWLLEKIFGLSRHRRLPRFHRRTFLQRARQFGWMRKPTATSPSRHLLANGKSSSGAPLPPVAFLADLYINHNDPQLGECAVRVLQHLGHQVYVPPLQGGSGMAPLQHGDIDRARQMLERNLAQFADLVREGYIIISPEPSAVLMFRDDAKNLLSGAEIDHLASHTFEWSEYVAQFAAKHGLPPIPFPLPITLAYHEPCHQRALMSRSQVVQLLQQIPQLRLRPVDLGCSGMAGTFGLRFDGFQASLDAGSDLLNRLRQPDVQYVTTQCSACKMQIEQGASRRTHHPARWFALAYGLAGAPEQLLNAPKPLLLD